MLRSWRPAQQFILPYRRFLTTTITDVSALSSQESSESWRARLKSVPLNPKLLQFLDDQRLGYLTTRRSRKRAAIHYSEVESRLGLTDKLQKAEKIIRRFPFGRPATRAAEMQRWTPQRLPASVKHLPQIAVVGRSNVGKSTLLNWLAGFDSSFVQKSPMSDKPGETKSLVFYHLGRQRTLKELDTLEEKSDKPRGKKEAEGEVERNGLLLVDMPGYGFAFMNEEDTQRCQKLMHDYLLAPMLDRDVRLQRVLLLLDARHGLKQSDASFLEDLYNQYIKIRPTVPNKLQWKLQIVLTKCDLVERQHLCRLLSLLREEVGERFPNRFVHDLPIIPISTKEEKGLGNLLAQVQPVASFDFPSEVGKEKPTKPVLRPRTNNVATNKYSFAQRQGHSNGHKEYKEYKEHKEHKERRQTFKRPSSFNEPTQTYGRGARQNKSNPERARSSTPSPTRFANGTDKRRESFSRRSK